MDTITVAQQLVTQSCCKCQMLFAVPLDFDQRRRNDHARFFCPAGHGQSYTGETEEEKLRRERNYLKQENARLVDARREAEGKAEHERRRALGFKGQAAKSRKKLVRVSHGVCPCCNRTFADLAAHMNTKHPGFALEKVEEPA